jgi:putative drug exporter of the RND superfamily
LRPTVEVPGGCVLDPGRRGVGIAVGKLQGAEKNDASSYLPSSAESTQEMNEQDLFQSKNLNPALVVYLRSTGVTAAGPAQGGR